MATNNFKAFALDPNANVMSQADWEALPALLAGFSAGKASSAQVNKAIRQASFIAAALAQYTANRSGLDVLDDGNLNGFITKMTTAFGKDFQALDATLTALAGLGTGANKLPYFTGIDTAAQTDLTSVGRDIIGKTDVASVLAYLKLDDAVHGDGAHQIGFSSAQEDAPYMKAVTSGNVVILATKVQLDGKQTKDDTLTNLSGRDVNGLLQYLGLSDAVHGDGTRRIGFSSADATAPYMTYLPTGAIVLLGTKAQVDGKQPKDNTLTDLSGKDAAGIRQYLGVKTAGLRDVGTGANQIPDMSSQGVTYVNGGGVQYFPNGQIRQWGQTGEISGSGASVNITFPVPFPNEATTVRTFDASNPTPSVNLAMASNVTKNGVRIWAIGTIAAAGPSLGPWTSGAGTYWEAWGR